jgi:hypothetical protein
MAEKHINISVIVEGYNSRQKLGEVSDLVGALIPQETGVSDVELVFVGSGTQLEGWRQSRPEEGGFAAVRYVEALDAHYYELKNLGARAARGSILAFLDSDVVPLPGWVQAARQAFTDPAVQAVAGVSLFRFPSGPSEPYSPLLFCAASVSWGFVVPRGKSAEANAFLSHNFLIRRDSFAAYSYRTDLGRTCAGSFLHKTLQDNDVPIRFAVNLRVAHNFGMGWWLAGLHRRFGHEVYLLRRTLQGYPDSWLRGLGWLEPLLYWPYAVLLDLPRWWRFSRWTGTPLWRRLSFIPVVLSLSLMARGSELLGMYATILRPKMMRDWAGQH